jgi:hypothetical protein
MSDTPSEPIIVNPSGVPTVIETSIGQIVPAISALLAAFIYLSPAHLAAINMTIPIILCAAWRIYRALQHHGQRVTMAHAAPDNVAQVRSS